ncbi:DNA-3-methyladenine glycosylase-like [Chelonus insularis]|uniref:DNA-3-methyladenine glycosylase-like n=1 Tax=Chelonus insularis TaxID=460826 RepID=UPI0015890FC0|nr:DNA-3-methyladenine glycosylase-like [Chelonus insularis]
MLNDNKNEPTKKKQNTKVDLKSMEAEFKQLQDPPTTLLEKELSANRLIDDFYNVPCIDLAQNLLGKILVRQLENGTILKGRIVETESYLGGIDKASQSYQNKITPRTIPMYMLPGTIYIYFTYGMYYCFNISSQGEGAAVLLRGVEPIEGIEEMENNRISRLKSKSGKNKGLKVHELCNGPSKLCIAYNLNKDYNKYSLCSWKGMWIENDSKSPEKEIQIVKCARIGIDSAGPEWASKPLRFYIYGNTSVSKRDKKAEAGLVNDK